MNEEQPHRQGAFFGRRKGKPLRAHQADLLTVLLPYLAIDLTEPPPAKLAALFRVPVEEVRLEIGFGGGEHLIAQALANPNAGFIGIEMFVNGMAKALAAIETHNLQNIRLHHGDAADLIAWLPDRALSRIDMLYPDPWPKRRHWKRRFINERSIAALARILRQGGDFRFASDWPHYAAWTLRRVLRSSAFEWTAECADDWRKPWPDFSGTRYEAKARREGRTPCYLTFRRV
ncbi:MAG TPA: tRNA (guanosine(46)-N7)-methyltransferase TrmB [Pseudorhodoplanes sp.]|jgi:tRNA (guanine-N7-)-methyltransferase|nr:tRNA (guanosine(46)-N7)-methyltransferase TrmB [Pseudorhodoplanes sp.]